MLEEQVFLLTDDADAWDDWAKAQDPPMPLFRMDGQDRHEMASGFAKHGDVVIGTPGKAAEFVKGWLLFSCPLVGEVTPDGIALIPRPDLAGVLDQVSQFVRRYVFFKDPRYADVVALWAAMTWVSGSFDVNGYLNVTSPEMSSGKSRLLEVLEMLCRDPWYVIEPSEAVTFRKISQDRPTLLLDEIDGIFNDKRGGDVQAGLRGVFNAGYRKGATVPRALDFGRELTEFGVFCPKAFGGIGRSLPPTVVSRSIRIPMVRRQRNMPGEEIDRWHRRDVTKMVTPLREKLAKLMKEAENPFLSSWREWRPEAELLDDDRQHEIWEPLYAVAEAANGHWFNDVRELARMTVAAKDDEPSAGILLLKHCREIILEANAVAVTSKGLMTRLKLREDGPWAKWWRGEEGNLSDLTGLARMLKPYDIHSKKIRKGDKTVQGYARDDFDEAWRRWLGQ